MSTDKQFVANHIWAEKYRPSTLEEVILPMTVKKSLQAYVVDGKIPSFIFYSPSPGTGKTTTALALCHDLDADVLFMNASIDNSIDDIRMKVIGFATTSSLYLRTKVVVLDEAERLSVAAQESLKGLIEQVSCNCSFILTSNSKSKIVEPLQSRCTPIEFIYTPNDQAKVSAMMYQRCAEILTLENVTFDKMVLLQVVKKFSPDNRRILMALQQYAKENSGTIDNGILGQLASVEASELITTIKDKDFNKMRDWVFANQDRLGDDFYLKFLKTIEPKIQPISVAQLVLDLNDYQRFHNIVPDKYLHFSALFTVVMMGVTFK